MPGSDLRRLHAGCENLVKRVPRSQPIIGAAPTTMNGLPSRPLYPFHPFFGSADQVKDMRQPDPITLRRLCKVLGATRPLLVEEITTAWLARTLARVDGGPTLDAPRLGPALRTLGFRSARRRRGARRVRVWLRPGPASPRLGRPPQYSHPNVRTISNRGEQRHGY